VNQILRIASAIFRLAIKRGQCPTNPLDRVDRAHKAAREIKFGEGNGDALSPESILDPAEIRRLVDAANSGFDRTLFLTAFVTGARQGELLALKWTDLELPTTGRCRMYIRRSLQWAHLKGEFIRPRFYPPKTKAGLRAISIPTEMAAVLRRWKLQCPPSEMDLVFPAQDGKPMRWDHLLRTRFYPTLSRARLRRVTFHSLRHSCASAMIAAGAPVTEVQHQLGHSNPSITLGIYSHWFKNAESGGVVDALARASIDLTNPSSCARLRAWKRTVTYPRV
jgi:integrase